MLFRLLLLFIIVPLVELTLLLMLADRTSWTTTLLVVVVTGILGTALARSQGFRTVNRIRQDLSEGRMPADALVDAVMILVAGALLLTPGLLTDLFGLSLLVPLCRRYYRRAMKSWFKRNFRVTTFTSAAAGPANNSQGIDSQVIDSYVVHDENDRDE